MPPSRAWQPPRRRRRVVQRVVWRGAVGRRRARCRTALRSTTAPCACPHVPGCRRDCKPATPPEAFRRGPHSRLTVLDASPVASSHARLTRRHRTSRVHRSHSWAPGDRIIRGTLRGHRQVLSATDCTTVAERVAGRDTRSGAKRSRLTSGGEGPFRNRARALRAGVRLRSENASRGVTPSRSMLASNGGRATRIAARAACRSALLRCSDRSLDCVRTRVGRDLRVAPPKGG